MKTAEQEPGTDALSELIQRGLRRRPQTKEEEARLAKVLLNAKRQPRHDAGANEQLSTEDRCFSRLLRRGAP